MGKVDHSINENNRLQGNFAMSRWTEFDINTRSPLGTRSQQQRLAATDWSYGLRLTRVAGEGHMLHEMKVSYFPRFYEIAGISAGGPPLTADGQVNLGHESSSSAPQVTIASVATFGSAGTDSAIVTQPVQAIYSMSLFRNRHSFKFGADYLFSQVDLNFYSRLRGAYSFSSLDNYLAGRYTNYSQSFGNPQFVRDHNYFSGYVQDSWQGNDRLTVNYGVRYDAELQPKHPITGQRLGSDYKNLWPRFGFSYDLSKKGTTFLKASTGIYVDRLYQRLSVWYPDLKDNQSIVSATWLPTDPGAPTYPAVFATTPVSLPRSVVNAWIMPINFATPTSGQVVGTLEHALTPNVLVSGSVVYTRSWNKEYELDTNLKWDDARQTWVRPDPNYRQLLQYQFEGKAEYVGGIAAIERRGARFSYMANLTVARSYDSTNTGDNFPNDQRVGIAGDWGPSADTPKVRGVVSGWYNVSPRIQVSGSFRARSGIPVTPTAAGLDLNGDLRVNDRTPTLARNSVWLTGTNSLDLRASWAPVVGTTAKLSLYLEGFNVLDRSNIQTVNTDYGPNPLAPKSSWLQPLTFFAPRQVQIGARLTF